jgi:sulfonate transport system substrate-binding protein
VNVKWTEFPFGPPLLEAINVGSIDLGTVGEAPPVFAQAAGADLVYVANEPPAPAAEGILVAKDSPLKTVADLKGKKVAFAKGSNVNYFVVKVLEKAGLKFSDIQAVHLAPADARAAFERGSVDAWGIWDPYLAAGETQLGARVLADGKGVVNNYQFYLASRAYAEKHPEIVKIVVEELAKIDEWGKNNPKEVAALLAPQIGLDVATAEIAANRYSYGVQPVTAAVLADQQKVADTFYDLKLIPKKVNVEDAAWKPARAKVAQENPK